LSENIIWIRPEQYMGEELAEVAVERLKGASPPLATAARQWKGMWLTRLKAS
jgi:hypothetical protein